MPAAVEIPEPEPAIGGLWEEDAPPTTSAGKVFVENEEFATAFYSDGDIPKDPRRMRRTRSSSCDKEVAAVAAAVPAATKLTVRRRERSRSPPDYRSTQRPRSPSAASRRPRSPSSNEEFPVAKSPGRVAILRSPTPSTPVEIPDEEIGSPIEEFENIDSDEEIGADAEWDTDYEPGFFEVINTFNPFEPLKKFPRPLRPLDSVRKFLAKYEAKIEFRHASFLQEPADNKDSWVHYAEQIVQQMIVFNGTDHSRNEETIEHFLQSHSPELATLMEYIKIGLTFDFAVAQPQPAYKIRHIKVGIRLVEVTCCYETLTRYVLYTLGFNIFEKLFSMYFQEFMALSIRLMIFKAFYSVLDSPSGIDFFLGDKNEFNGYQTLIELLQSNPTGRTMVAIKALIKKLNLFETFVCCKSTTAKIFGQLFDADARVDAHDWDTLTECLTEVQQFFADPFAYAQPKRFLPASAQFEIPKDAFSMPAAMNGVKMHMRANGFLETLLLIVSAKQKAPTACLTVCYGLLESVVKNKFGINYMVDNIEQTNALVKELFGTDFDAELDASMATRNRALALEIAYKVQF